MTEQQAEQLLAFLRNELVPILTGAKVGLPYALAPAKIEQLRHDYPDLDLIPEQARTGGFIDLRPVDYVAALVLVVVLGAAHAGVASRTRAAAIDQVLDGAS